MTTSILLSETIKCCRAVGFENYYDSVIPKYPDKTFHSHFCLPKFKKLVNHFIEYCVNEKAKRWKTNDTD